jgi:hypothetical protein
MTNSIQLSSYSIQPSIAIEPGAAKNPDGAIRQILTPEMTLGSVYEDSDVARESEMFCSLLKPFAEQDITSDPVAKTAFSQTQETLGKSSEFMVQRERYSKMYNFVSKIMSHVEWSPSFTPRFGDYGVPFREGEFLFNLIDKFIAKRFFPEERMPEGKFSKRGTLAESLQYSGRLGNLGKMASPEERTKEYDKFLEKLSLGILGLYPNAESLPAQSQNVGTEVDKLIERYNGTDGSFGDFFNDCLEKDSLIIPCGTPVRNVHMYVKKIGNDKFIVQECDVSGRIGCREETIYSTHGNPGRVFVLDGKGALVDFIGKCYYLCRKEVGIGDYEEYIKTLTKCNDDPAMPWRFLKKMPLQRCGGCSMRSMSMACWVAFWDNYSKKSGDAAALGDVDAQKKVIGTLRLFEIYSRFSLLKSFLADCKEKKEALETAPTPSEEQRLEMMDMLRFLRDGSGRLFYYMERYVFRQADDGIPLDEASGNQLLQEARSLHKEIDEFLSKNQKDQLTCDSPHPVAANAAELLLFQPTHSFASIVRENGDEALRPRQYVGFSKIQESIAGACTAFQCLTIDGLGGINALVEGDKIESGTYMAALHRLAEIMRRIPLPGTPAGDSWYADAEKEDIEKLTSVMAFAMKMLTSPGSPGDRLLCMEQGKTSSDSACPSSIGEQLTEDQSSKLQLAEALPLANAVAKMRIVTWELAKKHAELLATKERGGGGPKFNNLILDQTWYTSFCKSPLCFSQNSEDSEEQRAIIEFTEKNAEENQGASKIFGCRNGKNGLMDDNEKMNIDAFYGACIGVGEVHKIKCALAKDEVRRMDGVTCICVAGLVKSDYYGEARKAVELIIGRDSFLRSFRDMMAYGTHGEMTIGNMSLIVKVPVCEFSNSLEGFQGLSGSNDSPISENNEENRRRDREAKTSTSSRRDRLNTALSYETCKAISLLHFFGENLDMCNGFRHIRQSTQDDDPNLDLYLWEHCLCRKGDLTKESPLEMDAKERPRELMDAANALREKGIRRFWKDQPASKPAISSLVVVFHAQHMIQRKIIQQNKLDAETIKASAEDRLKVLKELERTDKDSHSEDEICLLKLAINECYLELFELAKVNKFDGRFKVDDEYAKGLIYNAFRLASFDSHRLMKGFLFAARDFAPTLSDYWEKFGDQAEGVCKSVYKKVVGSEFLTTNGPPIFSATSGGSVCVMKSKSKLSDGSSCSIDLLSLRILKNGYAVSLSSTSFDDKDYRRLFGNKNREMSVVANSSRFKDEGYGKVEIVKKKIALGTKDEREEITIYRTYEGKKWEYIPPNKVLGAIGENMFWCTGDDFTVWKRGDGVILICPKDSPDKPIFRPDSAGRLKSLRPEDGGCIVGMPSDGAGDVMGRFEGCGAYFVLLDKDTQKVKEIVFPRYRNSVGQELRLEASGDGELKDLKFFLKENPKFQLIAAPKLKRDGKERSVNPLLSYGCALWFTNTDEKNGGTYKAIMPNPDVTRNRDAGLSHKLDIKPRQISSDKCFFGSEQTAEVSFFDNPLDFVAPNLKPTSLLASLRLGHAFQAQGEYEKALEIFRSFSPPISLSEHEFNEFKNITTWFLSRGHEQSPQAACVVAAAFSRLLRIAPWDKRTKEIAEGLLKEEFLSQFFSAAPNLTATLRMPLREEKLMWTIVVTLSMSNDTRIKERLDDLKKLTSHLKKPMKVEQPDGAGEIDKPLKLDATDEEQKQRVANLAKSRRKAGEAALEEAFNGHDGDRMEALKSEDAGLLAILAPPTGLQSNSGDVSLSGDALDFSCEKSLREFLEAKIGGVFAEPEEVPDDTVDAPKLVAPELDAIDRRQLKGEVAKMVDGFNDGMEKGAKQLAEKQRDAYLTSTIGEKGQIVAAGESVTNDVIEITCVKVSDLIKTATQEASDAAREVQRIANFHFFEAVPGAGVWEKQEIPSLLRQVYGVALFGRRDLAMRHMIERHPGFPPEQLDPLLRAVEKYLVAVTSLRHLRKIHYELDQARTAVGTQKLPHWTNAVVAIRELRRPSDGGVVLERMSLLYEYMAQVRPRADQMVKIKFILEHLDDRGIGVLIQQIMGSGKSKVLIPFLVVFISLKYDKLVMIVSHDSQFPAVFREIPPILQSCDMRLESFNSGSSELSTPEQVKLFRRRLKLAHAAGNCAGAMSGHSAMSIKALSKKLRERNLSKDVPLLKELEKTMAFFETKCIGIFDEQHLWAPIENFSIQNTISKEQMGKVDEDSVNFLARFMHFLPQKLLDAMRSNQQDQIPEQELKELLDGYVSDYFFESLFGEDGGALGEVFSAFSLGYFDGITDENQGDLSGEKRTLWEKLPELQEKMARMNPTQKSQVALLHFFCSHLLPSCFKKKYLDDFGYNSEGIAVPYHNRLPTKNFFQSPMESLFYLNMCVLIGGISKAALASYVAGMAQIAMTQVTSEKPFNETPIAIYFEAAFKEIDPPLTLEESVDGELNPKPEIIAKIAEFLEKPERYVKRFQMAVDISQNNSSFCDESFSATPQILASLFSFSVALSGTTYNRSVYAKVFSDDTNLSPQEGATEQVAVKFCQDIKEGRSRILAPSMKDLQKGVDSAASGSPSAPAMVTAANILDIWWKDSTDPEKVTERKGEQAEAAARASRFRLFVDSGSLLINQQTRSSIVDVAKFLSEKIPDISHIEYFDTDINQFAIVAVQDVIDNGDKFHAQSLTNSASQRPPVNKLFTFLDGPRAVGSDPAMMFNGVGLMTGNPASMTLDTGLQAFMRARGFLRVNGQQMDFLTTAEAVDNFKLMDEDGKVSPEKILARMAFVLTKNVVQQRLYSIRLQIRELPQTFLEGIIQGLEKRIGNGVDKSDVDALKRKARDFFLDREDFSTKKWGSVREWKNAKKAFEKAWEERFSKLKGILKNALGEDFEGIQTSDTKTIGDSLTKLDNEVNEYIAERAGDLDILSCVSPAEENGTNPSAGDEALGNLGVTDVGVQIEVQAEVEIQQEVDVSTEVEIEVQQEVSALRNFFQGGKANIIMNSEHFQYAGDSVPAYKMMTAKKNQSTLISEHIKNVAPPPIPGGHSRTIKKSDIENLQKKFSELWEKCSTHKFSGTKNFFQAYENPTTIFHGSQMRADHLLIHWDEDGKNLGCCFVSNFDVNAMRSAIENGKLTHCYLCSSDGVPEAHHPTSSPPAAPGAEPAATDAARKYSTHDTLEESDFAACRKEAQWVAHFFNGDIIYLESNPSLTIEKFTAMGLSQEKEDVVGGDEPPTAEELERERVYLAGREEWLKTVHKFLCLRAIDSTKALLDIQKTSAVQSGKILNVEKARALASLGLSVTASDDTVVSIFSKMADLDFSAVLRCAFVMPTLLGKFKFFKEKIITKLDAIIGDRYRGNKDKIQELLIDSSDEDLLQMKSCGPDFMGKILHVAGIGRMKKIEKFDLIKYIQNEFRDEVFSNIEDTDFVQEIYQKRSEILPGPGMGIDDFPDGFLVKLTREQLRGLSDERIGKISNVDLLAKLEEGRYKSIGFEGREAEWIVEVVLKLETSVIKFIPPARVKEFTNEEAYTKCFTYYAANEWPEGDMQLFADNQLLKIEASINRLAELPVKYIRYIGDVNLAKLLSDNQLPYLSEDTFQKISDETLLQRIWEKVIRFRAIFSDGQLLKLTNEMVRYIEEDRVSLIENPELIKRLGPEQLSYIQPNLCKKITKVQIQKVADKGTLNFIYDNFPESLNMRSDKQLLDLTEKDTLKFISSDRIYEIEDFKLVEKLENDQLKHVNAEKFTAEQILGLSDGIVEALKYEKVEKLDSIEVAEKCIAYYYDGVIWPTNDKVFPDTFLLRMKGHESLDRIPPLRIADIEDVECVGCLPDGQLQHVADAVFNKVVDPDLLKRFWESAGNFREKFSDDQLAELPQEIIRTIEAERFKNVSHPKLIGKLSSKQLESVQEPELKHVTESQLGEVTTIKLLNGIFTNSEKLRDKFTNAQLVRLESEKLGQLSDCRVGAIGKYWQIVMKFPVTHIGRLHDSSLLYIQRSQLEEIQDKDKDLLNRIFENNESRRGEFSDNQLLSLSDENLKQIPVNRIKKIKNKELIKKLPTEQIKHLKDKQLKDITVDQLKKIGDRDLRNRIFTNNTLLIVELSDEDLLAELDGSTFHFIPQNRVEAIKNAELIGKLPKDQIPHLKDENLRHVVEKQLSEVLDETMLNRIFENNNVLRDHFTDDQILKLSQSHLGQISSGRIGEIATKEIVVKLSATQLPHLKDDQLAHVSEEQLVVIEDDNLLSRIFKNNEGLRGAFKDEQLLKLPSDQLGMISKERLNKIANNELLLKIWNDADAQRQNFSAESILRIPDVIGQTEAAVFQSWMSAWNLSDESSCSVVRKMFSRLNAEFGTDKEKSNEMLSKYFKETEKAKEILPILLDESTNCTSATGESFQIQRGSARWFLSEVGRAESSDLKKTLVERAFLGENHSFTRHLGVGDLLDNGWILSSCSETNSAVASQSQLVANSDSGIANAVDAPDSIMLDAAAAGEDVASPAATVDGDIAAASVSSAEEAKLMQSFRRMAPNLQPPRPRVRELSDSGSDLAMRLLEVANPGVDNDGDAADRTLVRLMYWEKQQQGGLSVDNEEVKTYTNSPQFKKDLDEDRATLGLRTRTQTVLLVLSISCAVLCVVLLAFTGFGALGVLAIGSIAIYFLGTATLISAIASITLGVRSRPARAKADVDEVSLVNAD